MSFLLSFFALASPAFAVTLTIEQAPATLTDQPFTVDITMTGASEGQNYLRVDLYKDGTNNYFGETSVGSTWYSGSEGTQYVPILIPDLKTVVTATLQARLGTPSPTEYSGPGIYKLRIRRYTASGSSSSVDETPVDVQIAYSFPTSTPSPTPSPTPTDIPTPTKVPPPTHTPTPTKSPTVTPTIAQLPTPTVKVSLQVSQKEGVMPSGYPTSVLGISDSMTSPTPTTKPDVLVKSSSENQDTFFTLILCGIGGSMLIICGILLYLKKRRGDILSL